MKTFAADMGFPEGPVQLPDGSFLFVEMGPGKGWVVHVGADGVSRRVLATTGRPNGLAHDRSGAIWVAESAQQAVLRMTLDGAYEQFVTQSELGPFLFLNDLAIGADGALYVTDSGILLDVIAPGGVPATNYRDLPYDGRVYRIDVVTREVEVLDRGIQFTNGIAFGPDLRLYVTETLSGNIYRYDCTNGRVTGKRELFGNVIENFDPAVFQGPDGMKFGADGNLYVAVFGQGDITVLGKRGEVVKRIETSGAHPTNVCFGPKGSKRIYVTEVETSTVQMLEVDTDGFALYD